MARTGAQLARTRSDQVTPIPLGPTRGTLRVVTIHTDARGEQVLVVELD